MDGDTKKLRTGSNGIDAIIKSCGSEVVDGEKEYDESNNLLSGLANEFGNTAATANSVQEGALESAKTETEAGARAEKEKLNDFLGEEEATRIGLKNRASGTFQKVLRPE